MQVAKQHMPVSSIVIGERLEFILLTAGTSITVASYNNLYYCWNRLCGLVVRFPSYTPRGHGANRFSEK
jgi:hypothetical protein